MLIVDDHTGFRSFARALLEAEGFDVIGEAEDASSALATTARPRPQIVLLDIQLPDIHGFEIAERLARAVDPAFTLLRSDVVAGQLAAGLSPRHGQLLDRAPAELWTVKADGTGAG